MPVNIAHSRCTVLQCCVERKFDSCVQCQKLASCDKELWKNWPDFRKQMEKLQQAYLSAGQFKLS